MSGFKTFPHYFSSQNFRVAGKMLWEFSRSLSLHSIDLMKREEKSCDLCSQKIRGTLVRCWFSIKEERIDWILSKLANFLFRRWIFSKSSHVRISSPSCLVLGATNSVFDSYRAKVSCSFDLFLNFNSRIRVFSLSILIR